MESSRRTTSPDQSRVVGAQRLAASMESSPNPGMLQKLHEHVLNALRHQWNPHMNNIVSNNGRDGCSTPCGINGILTAWVLTCWFTKTCGWSCAILNALQP